MQFHLLSFEGPDLYARAGGISTRVVGLAEALAERGFDTHLWFIGDPSASGVEQRGNLTLHRWCQSISAYAPLGVYQQEEAKERDLAASLPAYLMKEILGPHLEGGGEAVDGRARPPATRRSASSAPGSGETNASAESPFGITMKPVDFARRTRWQSRSESTSRPMPTTSPTR